MPISLDRVAATVSSAVGQPTVDVVTVHGSVANHDFVVRTLDGRRVVLKAGPENEIAAEAWACRHLTSLGVPVPRLITVDCAGTNLGSAYLVVSFVDGQPTEHPEVLAAAGGWLRRVHDIQLTGWGPLVVDPGTGAARGRYQSWAEAIRAELAGIPDLVTAGLLTPAVADTILAVVEVEQVLEDRGPAVLLHNDLKPAHIFGSGDPSFELTAIIDWGDARVGDPVADLARMSMAGPAVAAEFFAGYGISVTADLDDRLARYRLCWNAAALSYEYEAGGDWFDVYRARILDDINLLSQ